MRPILFSRFVRVLPWLWFLINLDICNYSFGFDDDDDDDDDDVCLQVSGYVKLC